jgi:hypothetical protein
MTAFLEGIEQTPTQVGDRVLGTPILYADAGAWMGLFPASMGALRRLLPSRELKPARLAPGVGLVGVVGYDYRVTPVGPYLEVGILIPLARGLNVPVKAIAAAQLGGRSHVYVQWLPVDRADATGGEAIWGMDSVVADITRDGEGAFALADHRGPVLELRCDPNIKTRPREGKVMESTLYTWLEERTQSFDVRLNVLEEGASARFGSSRVTLNEDHPRGRALAQVLLSRKAIATSVVPRSESILYLPERIPPGVLLHGRGGDVAVAAPSEAGA